MGSSATTSASGTGGAQDEPRILLTGFEPFGGSAHNSSDDVVSEVARRAAARDLVTQQEHDDVVISTLTLPVEFGAAGHLLTAAVDQQKPDVVLSVGLAAGTDTLRLKAAQQRILAAEIPVSLSLSAGTFVCNEVPYTLLHHISAAALPIAAGFVHVPDLRGSDSPLSLAQAADAVDLVIAESLKSGSDPATLTGALH